jgi:hypothetical protein
MYALEFQKKAYNLVVSKINLDKQRNVAKLHPAPTGWRHEVFEDEVPCRSVASSPERFKLKTSLPQTRIRL